MLPILLTIKILLVVAGIVLVFQGGSLLIFSFFLGTFRRNRALYAITLALGVLIIIMAFLIIPT